MQLEDLLYKLIVYQTGLASACPNSDNCHHSLSARHLWAELGDSQLSEFGQALDYDISCIKGTPLTTPGISRLKSQILKPAYLS